MDNDLIPYENTIMTAAAARAIEIMRTGKVPPEAIKTHPGKGGKTFSYISHVYLTRLLNDAFGQLWSTNILETHYYDDNSASVTLALHIDFPAKDGSGFYRRTITEVGSHDVSSGMTKADLVASASSRALYRCCMRAFGIGLDLYEEEEPPTNTDSWNRLLRYGADRGLTKAEVTEIVNVKLNIKAAEITARYDEAHKAIYRAGQGKKQEDIPDVMK